MLMDSFMKVICNANVHYFVIPVGEYVYVVYSLLVHFNPLGFNSPQLAANIGE